MKTKLFLLYIKMGNYPTIVKSTQSSLLLYKEKVYSFN